MHSRTYVCVPCRNVKGNGATCQFCGECMQGVYYRLRMPKKNNHAAWKLIEAGDWYWDKKAVERKKDKRRQAIDKTHTREYREERKRRIARQRELWEKRLAEWRNNEVHQRESSDRANLSI